MRTLWRRLRLTALASLVAGAAVAGGDEAAPPIGLYLAPQTSVRLPDGRAYNLVCIGKGGPLAILDVGLSNWSFHWRAIQPRLAKITRVCAADRAGCGFSDPGRMPRDAVAEVSDLEQALKAAGLRPPYVIMGHSLGGLNARLFAYRNPGKVAGLLLIDPAVDLRAFGTPDEFRTRMNLAHFEACAARARAGELIPGEALPGDASPCAPLPDRRWTPGEASRLLAVRSSTSAFETALAEYRSGYQLDSDEVAGARRRLGDIPLVILSQDKAHFRTLSSLFPGHVDQAYADWIGGRDDEARDSTRGVNRVVAGASHDVEADRPDVVVDAFREVVAAARLRSPP